MRRSRNKEPLVLPKLSKEQINIIKSVLHEIEEFGELSNFARMDIAESIKARKLKKNCIIINKKDVSTANIYIIISGTVRLISTEKKFKEYAKENNITAQQFESMKNNELEYIINSSNVNAPKSEVDSESEYEQNDNTISNLHNEVYILYYANIESFKFD